MEIKATYRVTSEVVRTMEIDDEAFRAWREREARHGRTYRSEDDAAAALLEARDSEFPHVELRSIRAGSDLHGSQLSELDRARLLSQVIDSLRSAARARQELAS